jgi:hypothetical protein
MAAHAHQQRPLLVAAQKVCDGFIVNLTARGLDLKICLAGACGDAALGGRGGN